MRIFLPLSSSSSSKNHAFIRRHGIHCGDYEKWPRRSSSPFNLNATVPTSCRRASQRLTEYTCFRIATQAKHRTSCRTSLLLVTRTQ